MTDTRVGSENCQVRVHVADVNDEAAMEAVPQAVGPWDVFFMNAGIYLRSRVYRSGGPGRILAIL